MSEPLERRLEVHLSEPLELMEIRNTLFREIGDICKRLPTSSQPESVQFILMGRRLGLEWPPVEFFQRALKDTHLALAECP